jgi:asparaginyl-tRNA synthetase
MVEPEVAFAQLADVMDLAEQFLTFVVQRVLDTRAHELTVLGRDITKLEAVRAPFPRLTYEEAIQVLRNKNNPTQTGDDFGGDEETIISQEFDRPVIIHHYPAALKAFYMQPDQSRPDLALCMDVLAPEGYGEIIGGGQRIHDGELLRTRLKDHHLPEDAFQWYLDLRQYGSVPHAGFGMGIERAVSWICGLDHVREAIAFPRMLYKLYP